MKYILLVMLLSLDTYADDKCDWSLKIAKGSEILLQKDYSGNQEVKNILSSDSFFKNWNCELSVEAGLLRMFSCVSKAKKVEITSFVECVTPSESNILLKDTQDGERRMILIKGVPKQPETFRQLKDEKNTI